MIWLLIKTFLGKLITFISENYRVIAFILLLALTYYYKVCYDSVQRDYELFKANITQATEIRKAENAQLAKYAKQAVEYVTLHHTEQMELIKHDYEKRNKVNVGTIANLRDRLRDKIASDSVGVSETASDTSLTSEEWQNRYTTIAGQYQTLKDGCIITTNDYNALRDYADSNCQLFGCE